MPPPPPAVRVEGYRDRGNRPRRNFGPAGGFNRPEQSYSHRADPANAANPANADKPATNADKPAAAPEPAGEK